LVRAVLTFPDVRLKQVCAPVGVPGPAIRRLADDLRDTARSFGHTVGIAAPQIGVLERVIWIDCTGHKKVPDPLGELCLVDPIVVEHDGAEVGREGCLSLPDITANVRRATHVVIEAQDVDGTPRRFEARDFEARVLLHEIDHLDGVLILDRVASLAHDVFPRRAR
jgi:peptide deformylase